MIRAFRQDISDALSRRAGDNWYPAGMSNATALTIGAPTANNLRAMPFFTHRTITLDRLAINVTTLAAGSARMGIYADTGNTTPGARLLDAGEVDTGTAGVKVLNVNIQLSPGLYWLVLVSNAAATIRVLSLAGCKAILGTDATLGTAPGVGYVAAFSYAALPATFPASPAMIVASPIPALFARISQVF